MAPIEAAARLRGLAAIDPDGTGESLLAGAEALELLEWIMADGSHNWRLVMSEWYGGRNGMDALRLAKEKSAK